METFLIVFHVFVCLFLVLVVLLQAGKGGGLAAFGGATTQTVFGGSGAGNLMTKLTTATAFTFMLTSMLLAYIASNKGEEGLKAYGDRARKEAEQRRMLEEGILQDAGVDPSTVPGAEGAPPPFDTPPPADTDTPPPADTDTPPPAPADKAPAPAPADKPADKAPAPAPADKPADKAPAPAPADKPADKAPAPAPAPADKPVDKPPTP